MQVLKSDNLASQLGQVDNLLSLIEVKGDSVVNLFKARTILKGLFDLIKEEKEKPDIEKEGG